MEQFSSQSQSKPVYLIVGIDCQDLIKDRITQILGWLSEHPSITYRLLQRPNKSNKSKKPSNLYCPFPAKPNNSKCSFSAQRRNFNCIFPAQADNFDCMFPANPSDFNLPLPSQKRNLNWPYPAQSTNLNFLIPT